MDFGGSGVLADGKLELEVTFRVFKLTKFQCLDDVRPERRIWDTEVVLERIEGLTRRLRPIEDDIREHNMIWGAVKRQGKLKT